MNFRSEFPAYLVKPVSRVYKYQLLLQVRVAHSFPNCFLLMAP
jgi:hypothetical protein